MLVLSRHRDESIMIGDDVRITVVDIRGDKVRLGIDAPQEIPVHRQEVYDAIKRENARASKPGAYNGPPGNVIPKFERAALAMYNALNNGNQIQSLNELADDDKRDLIMMAKAAIAV